MPRQRQPLAGALDRHELGPHRSVLDPQRQRRAEAERIRPGGGDHPVRRELDPRHDRPVVRAQRELHPHRNPAPQALDDPHQTRRALTSPRHEVDHADGAVRGLELGLEHERPGPVATRGRAHLAGRREQPAPMPLVPQQGREARRGVKARQAQPVDRSVAADQRRGLQVADEAVVLERHRLPSRSALRDLELMIGCERHVVSHAPARQRDCSMLYAPFPAGCAPPRRCVCTTRRWVMAPLGRPGDAGDSLLTCLRLRSARCVGGWRGRDSR